MRCQGCGKENPPGSLFCQQCGTRLVSQAAPGPTEGRTCPRCGTSVPSHMRFCTECGQAMAPAAPSAPAGAGAGAPQAPAGGA
ncbi:MAG: zinc-ribbon domain-containing protein, partial [Myxococcota bacterium]